MEKLVENKSRRRTVITGMGIISPFGVGKDLFWQSLENNLSGVRPITLFSCEKLSCQVGCEIQDFNPKEILGKKGLRLLDRATQLLLSSSKLALDDAGIVIEKANKNLMGVVVGTTQSCLNSRMNFLDDAFRDGPRAVNPALFPNTVVNSPASQVSIRFGVKGGNATISNGYTSTTDAMEYAADLISAERVDTVLVGGLEEFSEIMYNCAYKAGHLSSNYEKAWSPFSSNSDGTILGEGAVVLVLEELQKAEKRGAHIYAEYKRSCSDYDKLAYNKYNKTGSGLKKSVKKVLKETDLQPEQIDLLISGANGIKDCDFGEQKVIDEIFSEKPLISVPKHLAGETASASGGVSIAAGLLAFEKNIIPSVLTENEQGQSIKTKINRSDSIIQNMLITSSSPQCKSSATVISKYNNKY